MKQQVIILDKPIGKTPLEMVSIFKQNNPEHKDTIISYAGRLDPMAHGLLILLVGEENKNRQAYLHLDKTYEVEILFGFETDTYDILGKVTSFDFAQDKRGEVEKELETFVGKREQEYPAYSSKTVGGKPLFWWARENRLDEINIPKKIVEIFSVAYISERQISAKVLLSNIKGRIDKVVGNFRQEEILIDWGKSIDKDKAYTIAKIQVACSSGTYMRSLANELGNSLKCGAIAYDIYRTKVGEYTI